MIKTLTLKFGRAPNGPAETIQTTPVTVFVGPNNSGKSKVLAEIHRFCSEGKQSTTDVLIDNVEFDESAEDAAVAKVNAVSLAPRHDESIAPRYVIVGKRGARINVSKRELIEGVMKPSSNKAVFCHYYLSYNTLMLDGQSRIGLVKEQQAGDLQAQPRTSFQVLFADDARRGKVRQIVYEAFDAYLVIDPTRPGYLRLRLSPRAPESAMEERGLHAEAVRFHADALPIEQASDGVKAFTGIMTEIISGDPAVLLIDEPEAFLHPSLAFKLGCEIARASTGSEMRIFVSTHSPNFVMGCIQSGTPVNIIRLTYRGGVATARILPNSDILRLMRNPLLRSTGTLSGLFYECVAVTEADADRAFYQEINERLLRYDPMMGIPNCLFINAQNKQTVQTIIKPLRELGIPAAGIVDIDILKDGGTAWSSFLESAFVPDIVRQSLSTSRALVKRSFEQDGKDMKQKGGVRLLNAEDEEAACNLLNTLAEYGLFVVPHGELESWLPGLGAVGHTPGWLIDIFSKMGEDPESAEYVKPSRDDVWAFVGEVRRWLVDPKRKGIPT